jgi:hypothetical protein
MWGKQLNRGLKGWTEYIEFVVHSNSQRLKRSLCWMSAGAAGCCGDGCCDKFNQLKRRLHRFAAGARLHHRSRNAVGKLFVTVSPQNIYELTFVEVVQEVRSRGSGGGVHPHIKRSIYAIRKAALWQIKLSRRNTEIEQYTYDWADPKAGHFTAHGVESRWDDPHPVVVGAESFRCGCDGQGVLVNSQDGQMRVGLEKCSGVTCPTQGAVDDPAGRHGAKPVDDLGEHHRGVRKSCALHGFEGRHHTSRSADAVNSS